MDVQVTVTLPDDVSDLDSARVSREVFEQVVAESYKNGHLSLKQLRLLLGLSSRFEAEDFIHRHKATGYTLQDLKDDIATMERLGFR